jgi:5-methylcytosine-specific restriction protein A
MVTDKDIERFYNSKGWKMLRQFKLCENPLCRACAISSVITPAVEIHHMRPIRKFWDDRFDIKFLLSLCLPCHTSVEDEVRNNAKEKNKDA